MAIVTWFEENGSMNAPFYSWRRGKKQVPFDPAVKPVLSYETRSIRLGDSILGPAGRPCGSVFWGEIQPRHLCTSGFDETSLYFTPEGKDAYARAYAKFKDKVYTQASNLTAIAEIAKTRSMVNQRLLQLWKGAKALRAGRFKEFANTFGIRPLKKHENLRWTRPKHFGALWLEYWMGWAPTVGDISKTIETLASEVPVDTVRAGSMVPLSSSKVTRDGGSRAFSQFEGSGIVCIQAQVQVTNPNLHLRQKLGTINVAKTVWETIPFSWFVDWFTNVGQVLGQFTDWVGLQLKNLTVSVTTRAESSWILSGAQSIFGWNYPSVMQHSKSWFWFSRYCPTALPPVMPKIGFPAELSLSRGATLASLLVTIFAPSKRKTI